MSSQPRKITVALRGPGADTLAGLAIGVPPAATEPHCQAPLIDIHETEDGLVLEADLPGATDQTVNILVEENVLNLHAEIASEVDPSARLLHQEYPVPGVFQRSFILSDEVDRSRITAELRNGVLRLHLPKAEQSRSRRIEIKNQ